MCALVLTTAAMEFTSPSVQVHMRQFHAGAHAAAPPISAGGVYATHAGPIMIKTHFG